MSEATPSEANPDTASTASGGISAAADATVGTDAGYAPPATNRLGRPLRNISEVRHTR